MAEQDIDIQILEELQKLKEVVSRTKEAENAYRHSSQLLEKARLTFVERSELELQLSSFYQTWDDKQKEQFLVWEQAYMSQKDNTFKKITKDISNQIQEAESAYRNSVDLLEKARQFYIEPPSLKEDLSLMSQKLKDHQKKQFAVWEKANTTRIDYLDEDVRNMKKNMPSDIIPEMAKLKKQIQEAIEFNNFISNELIFIKEKHLENIRIIWVFMGCMFIMFLMSIAN